MGVITDRIDEAFVNFGKHKDMIKLMLELLDQSGYKWGWQQVEFISYAKQKLEEIKK